MILVANLEMQSWVNELYYVFSALQIILSIKKNEPRTKITLQINIRLINAYVWTDFETRLFHVYIQNMLNLAIIYLRIATIAKCVHHNTLDQTKQ